MEFKRDCQPRMRLSSVSGVAEDRSVLFLVDTLELEVSCVALVDETPTGPD